MYVFMGGYKPCSFLFVSGGKLKSLLNTHDTHGVQPADDTNDQITMTISDRHVAWACFVPRGVVVVLERVWVSWRFPVKGNHHAAAYRDVLDTRVLYKLTFETV